MTTTYFKTPLGIEDATLTWKEAIENGSIREVMKLYLPTAVVMGALSPKMAIRPEDVKAYIRSFMKLPNLRIQFLDTHIVFVDENAISCGIYRFDFSEDGQKKSIVARYTFVFQYQDLTGEWLIAAHHSSVLPQKILA